MNRPLVFSVAVVALFARGASAADDLRAAATAALKRAATYYRDKVASHGG